MAYLLAGPVVCLLGIVAVYFVFHRKSVEKRSMYSARRQQIEHKVRAARQRTLTPKGHGAKATEARAGASPFDQQQGQAFEYFTPSSSPGPGPQPPAPPAPAFEPSPFATTASAPPAQAPPTPPPVTPPPAEPQWGPPAAPEVPWEPEPAAPPPAPPAEEFKPAPQPTPRAEPSEPAWTPAPAPSQPATKIEQPAAATASGSAAGGWSVVATTKGGAGDTKRDQTTSSSWQLASGDAPGLEAEGEEVKRPSGNAVALAQYAVLVVGLIMVLIGVLVMVANSHVT